jgi:uncharacterized SAM-binding protein YcdF (DUF218 family)
MLCDSIISARSQQRPHYRILIINKILPLLMLPFGFSLLCLLAGLFLRNTFFLWLGTVVLLVFSMPVMSDFLIRSVEVGVGRVPVSRVAKADAIVVLSGMIVTVDGAPLGEWGDAVDRFDGGVELFKAGRAPVLVFTRGQVPWQPDAVPEGELLAKRALLLGVPQSAIRLTARAGNTAEEAVAASVLLGVAKKGVSKRIILVTSAFHMRRARFLFEHAGFVVEPFLVDYQGSDKSRVTVLSFLPNAEALAQSDKALREVIGFLFYWIRGLTGF